MERIYRGTARPDYTPDKITTLKDDEVFVFGSNLKGAHGGGAAWIALQRFGAVLGQGVGLQGQSYAIPTMHGGTEAIRPYVDEFIRFAKQHDELFFYVTRIGCGIAGFKDEEMAPLFADAAWLDNVCLPKSFADIIRTKVPQEVKTIMYGQMRTMVDLLKALNEEEPIVDAADAEKRLLMLMENNVRYGDNIAFIALRTLHHLICGYQEDGRGVDLERLERDLYDFHKDHDSLIWDILYNYSVSKLIKYIQFLNDFRRYSDYNQINDDLLSIPVSHCSSNDERYYYSFNPYALYDLCWILKEEWSNISRDGHLDNAALEETVIGRHERMLREHGLREMIRLAYGQVGCHPDIQAPDLTGHTIYGPTYRFRDAEIEKGCSDFRRWPWTSTSFEMKFAEEVLDSDPGYTLVDDDFYIPVSDYTLPVYSKDLGKMRFANEEEKMKFIRSHQ